MRVYAESNFVLEMVLDQEQCSACESLVELAEQGAIQLAIPSLAVLEPWEAIERKAAEWRSLERSISNTSKQLSRTLSIRVAATDLGVASGVLIQATQAASDRFRQIVLRLLQVAELLPSTRAFSTLP